MSKKYKTHVICYSISIAENLKQKFADNSEVITSKTSTNELKAIINKWVNGKLQILISTSTAVAGIDSFYVERVIFYGMPFSLMYVQQGVGRLRQKGSVAFVVNLNTYDIDGDASDIFSNHCVKLWLQNVNQCRLQAFNKMFSGRLCDPCNDCDICKRSPVLQNIINIQRKREEYDHTKDVGEKLYIQCQTKCGFCDKNTCYRYCNRYGCYKCGEKNHFANVCLLDKTSFHQRYSRSMCFTCYRYQTAHHVSENKFTCHTQENKNMFKNFLFKCVVDGRTIQDVCDGLYKNTVSQDDFFYKLGLLISES